MITLTHGPAQSCNEHCARCRRAPRGSIHRRRDRRSGAGAAACGRRCEGRSPSTRTDSSGRTTGKVDGNGLEVRLSRGS